MYSCSAKLTVRTVLKLFKLCFVEILSSVIDTPFFEKRKTLNASIYPTPSLRRKSKFPLQQHSLKIYQEIKVESYDIHVISTQVQSINKMQT